MEFRELSGQRIRLINLSIEYLHDIHEYSIMSQFYVHLEYSPFKDLEETRAFLNKLFKRSDEITGHYWLIYHILEKKVIGTIGLLDIDSRKGAAELAYGLSPNFWGMGFFSEALNLVINWYFSLDGTYRLFIKTAVNNTNSIKAAKNLGFEKEGVLRGYYLDGKTSQRWDAALLSLLRSDIIK